MCWPSIPLFVAVYIVVAVSVSVSFAVAVSVSAAACSKIQNQFIVVVLWSALLVVVVVVAVVNQVLDSIINISAGFCSLWPEMGVSGRRAGSPLNCSSIRKSLTFVWPECFVSGFTCKSL